MVKTEAKAIFMSTLRKKATFRCATHLLCLILVSGCNGRSNGSHVGPGDEQTVSVPTKLESAFELHQRGQFAKALQIVHEVLIEAPQDVGALRLAIELFSQRGEFCEAGDLATQLAELDQQNAAMILIRGFDWHLRCSDFTAAESNLNRAVELAPDNAQVRRLLAQLLNAQGRRYEASQHVRQLIRLRAAESEEVLSLIDLSGPFLLVSFADFTDDSDVSLFSLGEARYLYVKQNAEPQEVLSLLDRVTEKFPNSTAAAAFRGRVLAETARLTEFRLWLTKLPAGMEEQPEYWSAIGMWLEQEARYPEAIRAFGECSVEIPAIANRFVP